MRPLHKMSGVSSLAALLAALLALGALSGCSSLAPVRLDTAAAQPTTLGLQPADRFDTLAGADADASAQPGELDLKWWLRFDDPALAGWVEAALQGNVGAALAAERVQQAQALLRSARAQGGVRVALQADSTLNLYRRGDDRRLQPGAALSLDVEPDLWGGLALGQRSAAAAVLRSQDLAQAARLSAAGLAARAYIEWRLAQQDQALLSRTLALQAEALRIVQIRVEAGLSPLLDGERARAELASTQAEQAAAAERVQQAAAALQVLAGQRPQAQRMQVAATPGTEPPGLPQPAGPLPQARPLDLLRQRPDLRAAEQALLVAAADAGVAQAALRPRLRLPGSLVVGSLSGGGALELVSATVAAVLDLTLFDSGAAAAQVQAAQSRTREAALLYRQTLLQALQQVEAAGSQVASAQARMRARQAGSQAALAAETQAQTLYRAGLTGFGDVIDAQRTALDNQRSLLQARADAATAAVNVFVALGWIPPAAPGSEASETPAAPAGIATTAPARAPRSG